MTRSVFLILLALTFVLSRAEDAAPDFNRDVRPILSQNCFKCHGMDDKARKSKLRLDVRAEALKQAKNDIAIVPGHPEKSALIERIESEDSEQVMPPPATKVMLTAAQKSILKKWVAAGAPYAAHWAFVPPQQVALTETRQVHPIDALVARRLEREGLKFSPEADRLTLCRRVYLDLIGLPPTPEEADAFAKDARPDAYERLVDTLLASPRYGERWARRWLDLARYADTNGFEKDRPRTIWPYRDWVIKAFNDDLPFDQFTVKQLAGDLVPNPTADDFVATGFHRNTMLNEEGGVDPLEQRYYTTVDRLNTTGTAWLGLTVGCCQCHTHKFDPILQTEYYKLLAFLNNFDEPEYSIPDAAQAARRAEIEAKIAKLESELSTKWALGGGGKERLVNVPIKGVNGKGEAAAVQADGSLVFGGAVPNVDTYTLTFETAEPVIDRLRLDVLRDGAKGPGRTAHGNFVLSDISVRVEPKDNAKDARTVKLVRAEADFSQASFDVQTAIAGNGAGGWAVDGKKKPIGDHHAVFYFDQPVKLPQGARWTVTLAQNYGKEHVIGKLKLWPGAPAQVQAAPETSRDEAIERNFKAWEQAEHSRAVRWQVLKPSQIKTNMAAIQQLYDGSLLAAGDITKSDSYELKFGETLAHVGALRLEALPDDSLPARGPGRVFYEGPRGDFFLSEFHILVDGKRQKVAGASQSFAAGNANALATQDSNMTTGWSVNGAQGKASEAVFTFNPPLEINGNLELKLLFERHFACPLGRFRISVETGAREEATASVHGAEIEAILAKEDGERTADEREKLKRHFFEIAPELAGARDEIKRLRDSIPALQKTLVLHERPKNNPRPTFVQHRGEFTQPGERVEAGVPGFLPGLPKDSANDRLAFARWLVSPENPLTARVIVNRQWQAFFGRGIVRTLDDFGYQGEAPAHPELLDWLAVEFMKQGWSLKKLYRLIVTSATYRQDSRVSPELQQRDPANVLLARGPRFRLEGEIIRDSVLKSAGILSEKMGGPGVFPPQPASVTTEGAYAPFNWAPSAGKDRHRRSVYTYIKRTTPFAMYSTFDGATPEACVAKREPSNSPLQALTLLNDAMFIEAAQEAAKAVIASPGSDEERVARLLRRCLTRVPEANEVAALSTFAKSQRERFAKKEIDAEAFAGKGGDAVERAVWTSVARAVFNLDEFVTKR